MESRMLNRESRISQIRARHRDPMDADSKKGGDRHLEDSEPIPPLLGTLRSPTGLRGPRRQDLRSRVTIATTGSRILEQELSAVGDRVPHAGQFGDRRLGVGTRPADRLVELGAKGSHLIDAEQVRGGDGQEHVVRPADGIAPGVRVHTGRDDLGHEVDGRNDLAGSVGGALAISRPPLAEYEIQQTPDHEDRDPGEDHEPTARVAAREPGAPAAPPPSAPVARAYVWAMIEARSSYLNRRVGSR